MLAEEKEEEERSSDGIGSRSSVVSNHDGSEVSISKEVENGGEVVVKRKTRRRDRMF